VLIGQAAGSNVTTIGGITKGDELHPMQAPFRGNLGPQCGCCTPSMIMSAIDIAHRHSDKLDEATSWKAASAAAPATTISSNRCWTRLAARRFRRWPNSRLQTTIQFKTAGFR
jgi:aerobic-type carbon monoxide dehydrogenase small subunit (CoxS/CutS family)